MSRSKPTGIPPCVFCRISDPKLTISTELVSAYTNWAGGAAYFEEHELTTLNSNFDQPTLRSLFPISTNPHQQIRIRFARESR